MGNDVYTATWSDFVGSDSLLYTYPKNLQTESYNKFDLNNPNFVHSTAYDPYVFVFFRETALESTDGKTEYSRVARLCKYDRGCGFTHFKHRWSTFFKSRLNCSIPGKIPSYFDNIQSATDFIDGTYADSKHTLFYGAFTTPDGSTAESAVCAFSLRSIDDAFNGNFKGHTSNGKIWHTVDPSDVPSNPRPGGCYSNLTNDLPEENIMFVYNHHLMDEAVPAFYGEPIVMKKGFRFTQIVLDPQIEALDKKKYDVLYIGTDNGRVLKIINSIAATSLKSVSPVIIYEKIVFSPNEPVRSLKIIRHGTRTELIAVADNQVQSLEMTMCSLSKTCAQCVDTRDPSCVWSKSAKRCQTIEPSNTINLFVQNISTGVSSECA